MLLFRKTLLVLLDQIRSTTKKWFISSICCIACQSMTDFFNTLRILLIAKQILYNNFFFKLKAHIFSVCTYYLLHHFISSSISWHLFLDRQPPFSMTNPPSLLFSLIAIASILSSGIASGAINKAQIFCPFAGGSGPGPNRHGVVLLA